MKRVQAAAFAIMILFTSHLTARAGVRPMFRHGKGHTGRVPYSGPASPAVKGEAGKSIEGETEVNTGTTYIIEVVARNYRERAQTIQIAFATGIMRAQMCGNTGTATTLEGFFLTGPGLTPGRWGRRPEWFTTNIQRRFWRETPTSETKTAQQTSDGMSAPPQIPGGALKARET
ncbi:MAG: hypothetical protein R6U43_08720 [Candidatus Krumholzibacteriales bacterium]